MLHNDNAKIKNIENKIPDITNLMLKWMKEKKEIPSITNLPTTTTALTAVGDKIPNVSNLVKKKKKRL